MLDAIKTENSKITIITIVPGVIATFPYATTFITKMVSPELLKESVLSFTTIGFVISIAVGLVLENIGSMIEKLMACILKKKLAKEKHFVTYILPNLSINSNEYDKIWDYYLSLERGKDNRKIIHDYYSSIVLRLKFELSLIPSIIFCFIGMCFMAKFIDISIFPNWWCYVLITSPILLISAVCFAWQSVDYIHKLRCDILKMEQVATGPPLAPLAQECSHAIGRGSCA